MDWKIVSFALTCILIIEVALVLDAKYIPKQEETYKFGEFEIEKVQLDKISETIGEEHASFDICKISENKCIRIGKIGN